LTCRVVRFSSFTRNRASSCCTSCVTVVRLMCSVSAALVKLPASTTRANARIASNRSKLFLAGREDCADSTNGIAQACALIARARGPTIEVFQPDRTRIP